MAIQDGAMMSQMEKDLYAEKVAQGRKIAYNTMVRGEQVELRTLKELRERKKKREKCSNKRVP